MAITATLKPASPSRLEISNGTYYRAFDRANQPFALTSGEYDLLISNQNFDFVVDGIAIVPEFAADAVGGAKVKTISQATYTILATDNKSLLKFTSASAVTVTVPSSLGTGFNLAAIQRGAGQVIFTPASGVTIDNANSHSRIAGINRLVTLIADDANKFVLQGETGN